MADGKEGGIASETLVVTTEDGVVITGNRLQALEGRLIKAVRRPFYIVGGLIAFLFVFLAGLGIVLSNMNDTVNNTDKIVTEATGPNAQAQQRLAIEALVNGMDCRDQANLQRLVDQLARAGFDPLATVVILQPRCNTPDPATTTTVPATTTTIPPPTTTTTKP